MIRSLIKIFLPFLIVALFLSSFCIANDEYWISFQLAGPDKPSPPEGPKCLLKIDSKGNVIIPPTVVVPNSRFVDASNSGIAINHGNPGLLNMWLPGRNQGQLGYVLFRAVISKKTLNLISIHRTATRTLDDGNLLTSKKGRDDFLIGLQFRDNIASYIGRRITTTGLAAEQWFFRPYECDQCSFGTSDDGRVAFFHEEVPGNVGNQPRPFYLQHIDSSGKPSGNKVLLKLQFPLTGFDVTNLLKGGRRLLLFSSTTPTGSGLFVIPLDGKTFQPIGKRVKIPIKNSSDTLQEQGLTGFTNLISMDPRGRFIITSGISGGQITYIPLDTEGRPGPQKVLIHCCTPGSDGGIDLLKD